MKKINKTNHHSKVPGIEVKVERNALSTIEFESADADMGYKHEHTALSDQAL